MLKNRAINKNGKAVAAATSCYINASEGCSKRKKPTLPVVRAMPSETKKNASSGLKSCADALAQ